MIELILCHLIGDYVLQCDFIANLSSALQGYSNCVMADLVSNYDIDLKFVKEAIDELKKEIKAYETR